MHLEWNLHYSRWVIDDGEPERHVGDIFDWFAVSLWSDATLTRTVERTKAAVPIADNSYRVSAEVIYVSHDPEQAARILDFGIKAISEKADILPRECKEGEYVTGEVRLELPLCTRASRHFAYRWRVNRISADLTPYVPDPVRGCFIRGASEVRYQDVVGTDSVHAKTYVLHCSDLNP
ncbi:MAG: hypothetical protein WCA10_22855 [Terracidiphilus sp.]